ncbi:MAG: cell division protein FtsA [Thermomicrobiales bacterium]
MAEQHFIGIDIGSTKLGIAVASSDPSGGLRYLGHDSVPSGGIKRGAIFDQSAFSTAFGDAIQVARSIARRPVADIVVSLSSWLVDAKTNQGQIDVDTGYPIYQPDVDRVIASSRAAADPQYQLIHRAVQGFAVNGERLLNPLGRVGRTLNVWVRDFSVPVTLAEGMQEAASAYDARVHAMVPSSVAAGEAVLRQDERERGVILLDIGGALTDVALYLDGVLYDIGGIEEGGIHISQDLAAVLGIPLEAAERLKMLHGIGSLSTMQGLGIEWTPRGIARLQREARDGTLRRDVPRAIAGARYQQLLGGVQRYIRSTASGLHFHAGVVITGGSANMPGIERGHRELMQLEVRRGDMLEMEGFPAISDPGASAAIGLVRYCGTRARSGAGARPRREQVRQLPANQFPWRSGPGEDDDQSPDSGRQWGRIMKEWMRGFIPARTEI